MKQQKGKPRGRPFKPGQCGNPGGRPKIVDEIKALAREHGPEAFRKVVRLMTSADERVVLAAANSVLDRAYGKATQFVDITQRRELADLTDAELADIARCGGAGIVAAPKGKNGASRVH
jgi:hypothetical protein